MRRRQMRYTSALLPLVLLTVAAGRPALPQPPTPAATHLAISVVWSNTNAPVERASVYVYGYIEGNRAPTITAPRTNADGKTTASIDAKINIAQLRVTHNDALLSIAHDWAVGQPRDITVTLARGARVSGVVTIAETGMPVEGARVELIDGSRYTTTDASGAYSLSRLPPMRECRIRVLMEGLTSYSSESEIAVFALVAGQHIASHNLTLKPGLSLEGVVRDRKTGGPIAGAEVKVANRETSRTDTRGAYLLRGLSAVQTQISASADGYVSDARLITPQAGSVCDFSLERGATIEVLVVDEHDFAVEGARISSQGGNIRLSPAGKAETDADGRIVIDSVSRLKPPRVSVSKSGFSSPGSATPVFAPGEDVVEIIFRLKAPTATTTKPRPTVILQGRVTDTEGKPIVGVTTRWGSVYSPTSGERAVTDEAGRYHIEGRWPSDLNSTVLLIDEAGWAPAWRQPDLTSAAEGPIVTDFTLTRGHWVEGLVVDESNNPAPGVIAVATFQFRSGYGNIARKSRLAQTMTDFRGRFRIENLPDSHVGLTLSGEGWSTEYHRNPPLDSESTFVILAPGVLRLRVVDDAGAPITNYLLRANGSGVSSAMQKYGEVIDSPDGDALLTDLRRATQYTITITAEGYATKHESNLTPTAPDSRDPHTITLTPVRYVQGEIINAETDAPITDAIIVYLPAKATDIDWTALENTLSGYSGARVTRSDERGGFKFEEAEQPGHLAIIAPGLRRTIVRAQGRAQYADLDWLRIPLTSGATLRGGLQPFRPDLSVYLQRSSSGSGYVSQSFGRRRLDASGAFAYSDLPPGVYTLQFEDRRPAMSHTIQTRRLTLADGEDRTIDLSESTGPHSLIGRVTFGDVPTASVHVYVSPHFESETRFLGAMTDAQGRYRIEGIAPGRYTVSANHRTALKPGFPRSLSFHIEIADDTTRDIVFPRQHTITGRLVPPSGADEDFLSRVRYIGMNWKEYRQTDPTDPLEPKSSASGKVDNGAFTFSGRLKGEYTVNVSIEGKPPMSHTFAQTITVDNLTGDQDVGELAFTPLGTHTLSGLVTDRGTPLAGVDITVRPRFKWEYGLSSVKTDAEGRYSFPRLKNGEYTISARKRNTDGPNHEFNARQTVDGDTELSIEMLRQHYVETDLVFSPDEPESFTSQFIQVSLRRAGKPLADPALRIDDYVTAKVKGGHIRANGRLKGVYNVELSYREASGHSYSVNVPDTITLDNLERDQHCSAIFVPSRGGITISGRVLNDDGPLPHTTVQLNAKFTSFYGQRAAKTDADGRYTFDGLEAGDYRVDLTRNDPKVGDLVRARYTVNIPESGERDFSAHSRNRLAMRFVFDGDTTPVDTRFNRVVITHNDTSLIDESDPSQPDRSGQAPITPDGALLTGRFRGDYLMQIYRDDQSSWTTSARLPATQTLDNTTGDQDIGVIAVPLPGPLTVTGQVRDEDGQPIPNARIDANPHFKSPYTTIRTRANEEGAFRVPAISTGEYTLSVWRDKPREGFRRNTNRRFAVSPTTTTCDLVVAAQYQIAATLTFDEAVPAQLRNAVGSASLRQLTSKPPPDAPPNQGPSYMSASAKATPLTFDGRARGDYGFSLTYRLSEGETGWIKLPDVIAIDSLNADQDIGELRIPAPGPVALEGRVADADGLPVVGAQVDVRPAFPSPYGQSQRIADSDGCYRVEWLERGPYRVTVRYPQLQSSSSRNVPSARAPEIRETITLDGDATRDFTFGAQHTITIPLAFDPLVARKDNRRWRTAQFIAYDRSQRDKMKQSQVNELVIGTIKNDVVTFTGRLRGLYTLTLSPLTNQGDPILPRRSDNLQLPEPVALDNLDDNIVMDTIRIPPYGRLVVHPETEPDGQPDGSLSEYRVIALPKAPNAAPIDLPANALTDTVAILVAGRYRVHMLAPGFASDTPGAQVNIAPNETTETTLTLRAQQQGATSDR